MDGDNKLRIDHLIHDLKGPLAVVEAGVTGLLGRRASYGPLTEKQEKVLRRIFRNVRITQQLVVDALELGRCGEGVFHPSRFALSEWLPAVLVEIFDLFDAEESERIRACDRLKDFQSALDDQGVTLTIDEATWERRVTLDRQKLTQILRNLLMNALKYRKRRVSLEVAHRDDFLVLGVWDDGRGIPPNLHERIFECYFQASPEGPQVDRGHGIGLAAALVLTEAMGGGLTLKSEEGAGARFEVAIPIKPA